MDLSVTLVLEDNTVKSYIIKETGSLILNKMITIEELKVHLSKLDIHDEVSNVTICDVNRAFRKLAGVMHPDKAGSESTAAFQEVLKACQEARKYFKEIHDADIEEIFEMMMSKTSLMTCLRDSTFLVKIRAVLL